MGGHSFARKFFWSDAGRLANSFSEIPGHVMMCRMVPQDVKQELAKLKKAHPEQMSRLPRGSQKVFIRRMWRRIHGDGNGDGDGGCNHPAAADVDVDNVVAASTKTCHANKRKRQRKTNPNKKKKGKTGTASSR